MSTLDMYRVTDKLDDTTLAALVTRLEARGQHPRFIAMMNDYLAAMSIPSARSVLDLGCGTGVVARAVATTPGFAGRVTGIDVSPYLIEAATRLAKKEHIDQAVDFRTGDSQALHLADASYDAVIAHTLLSHVESPLAVLKEIFRIVRPGGMVGIFDGDYASMTFENADPTKGKADDEKIIKAIVTNPRVMRQMPQLLREARFDLTNSFSYVVADIGKADFWATAMQSFVRLLPKAGAMTDREANDWADAMFSRSDRGIFFGASNYYSFVVRRPRLL